MKTDNWDANGQKCEGEIQRSTVRRVWDQDRGQPERWTVADVV